MSKGPVRKPGNKSPKQKKKTIKSQQPISHIETAPEKNAVVSDVAKKATDKKPSILKKFRLKAKPNVRDANQNATQIDENDIRTNDDIPQTGENITQNDESDKTSVAVMESPEEDSSAESNAENDVLVAMQADEPKSENNKPDEKNENDEGELSKKSEPKRKLKLPKKNPIHIIVKRPLKKKSGETSQITEVEVEDQIIKIPEPTVADKSSKKKVFKIALIAAASLVTLIILTTVISTAIILSSNRIHSNIYINDIRVSGMTVDEAADIFAASHTADWARDDSGNIITGIIHEIDSEEFPLTIESIGMRYLCDDTVERAFNFGREGNVFNRMRTIVRLWRNPVEIEAIPELYLNTELIAEYVSDFTESRKADLQDDTYEINNGYVYIYRGIDGVEFDNEAITEAFIESFLGIASGELLESQSFEPKITERKHVSLETIAEEVYVPVQNARFGPGGQSDIIAEQAGVRFDIVQARELLDSTDDNPAIVPLSNIEPALTASRLDSLGFDYVFADQSTNMGGSTGGRVANIILAAQFANGAIINPGEIFSFNEIVGRATAARGFQYATIFYRGQAVPGIGGGICQVSTTLYMAALHANMEIVQRRAHSFRVGYAPISQDCAIAYGILDLRWRNTFPYPVRVVVETGGGNVRARIIGMQPSPYTVRVTSQHVGTTPVTTEYRINNDLAPGTQRVIDNGVAGETGEATRFVYRDGVHIRTDFLGRDVYRMRPRVVERGPDAPEPEPDPPETEDE